jgi:arylsulfatase A-like enzyme
VPLLPRTLRAAGYHTAAFVTNPFLHESNRPVRACFEHFDASFIGDQGMTRGHGEKVWSERMWADAVNPAVRAYFDAHPLAGPEFTYVHYIDVHGRREGPDRWSGAPFDPSYEAAVRYVDGKIRELHDYFRARYGDELLFVVTSDHGQDLGDDLKVGDGEPWRLRKASLHDFNLRVPFLVLEGRGVPERVLGEPCANVDVAPTLLAWLGLPPQGDGPGESLLPAILGEGHAAGERPLYARNETNGRFEESVVRGGRKFLRYRRPEDGSVLARRCFELARDPRELVDVPDGAVEMEASLEQAAESTGPAFPARFEPIDEATRARLDDLGYGGEDG